MKDRKYKAIGSAIVLHSSCRNETASRLSKSIVKKSAEAILNFMRLVIHIGTLFAAGSLYRGIGKTSWKYD
jgi:hypothetical protein